MLSYNFHIRLKLYYHFIFHFLLHFYFIILPFLYWIFLLFRHLILSLCRLYHLNGIFQFDVRRFRRLILDIFTNTYNFIVIDPYISMGKAYLSSKVKKCGSLNKISFRLAEFHLCRTDLLFLQLSFEKQQG